MIKVFIVEDHAMVVEGIQVLLQHEKDITVIGAANTASACLDYFAHHTADVVLMDINLPDMNGVELCKIIKTSYKATMVLALSTFNQGIYMNKIMENGGSGYLLKNITRQELVDALKTVNKGGVYFSFEAGKIYKASLEKNSHLPVLTKREKEIMKLIAEGFTNIQISQQLFISIDTVNSHRKNLYTKLNIKNTASLIRYAIENGIVSYSEDK
jgi:DNA-binding NarL/FixJ family response regulator